MKHSASTMTVLLACTALVSAGIRADLSGDAVIDFQTTIDMPFMTVGNPGNADDTYGPGNGGVDHAYNIGKFEVTAGQYAEFLNAVAATDTYGLYHTYMADLSSIKGCNIRRSGSAGSFTYSVAADWEGRPVNYVDWGDTVRFANWLTNGMPTGAQDLTTTEDGSYLLNGATSISGLMAVTRKSRQDGGRYYIPTEDEWYKAAYHKNDGVTGNYFNYPTSSDAVSNDLTDPDPGNNANFWDGDYTISPYTIGSPYYRTEVGEFENSESPYGTFDMGGNVMEWNETILNGYDGLGRVLRGGTLYANAYYMHACYYPSKVRRPIDECYSIGFRVAEVLGLPGDFDYDGDVDIDDIETLCDNIGSEDALYDLDGDFDADEDDLIYMVEQLVEWSRPGGDSGVGTRRGDFNLDGLVNATDLAIMRSTFGTWPRQWVHGNANCDHIVDATDLAILKANFAFEAPTGAVPEPATLSLLAMGGLALLRRKHK